MELPRCVNSVGFAAISSTTRSNSGVIASRCSMAARSASLGNFPVYGSNSLSISGMVIAVRSGKMSLPFEIRPIPFETKALSGTALFLRLRTDFLLESSVFVRKPMERAQDSWQRAQAFFRWGFKQELVRLLLHEQGDVVACQAGKMVQPFATE